MIFLPTIRLFFLILMMGLSSYVCGQSLDSVAIAKLDTAVSYRSKTNLYEEVIQRSFIKGDYKQAIAYSKKVFHLAQAASDSVRVVIIYNHLVKGYYYLGEYDSSIVYGLKASDLIQQIPNHSPRREGKIYNNLGLTYVQKEEQGTAIEWLLKALEIRVKVNDPQVASTYTNLALLYYSMENFSKMLLYNQKAIDLKIKQKSWTSLIENYNIMGLIYDKLSRIDSSLYYYKKMLTLCKEQKQLVTYYNYHMNITFLYIRQKDYQTALNYATISYQHRAYPFGKSSTLNLLAIAQSCIKLKKTTQAKWALDRMNQIGLDSMRLISYYRALTDYFLLEEKYDSVRYYTKKIDAEELRRDKKEHLAHILEVESKYKRKEQKRQIEFLNKENELQAAKIARIQQQWWFLGILAFVLTIVVVYWFNYSKKLQQLNSTKDRLFTIIGHDLKKPLIAFRAITQSLSKNIEILEQTEIQAAVAKLHKSSNQLYLLIQNLLQWAFNQNKSMVLHRQKFALEQLVSEVFETFRSIAVQESIHLINEVPSNTLVLTDPKITQAILRNLVDNAIKFTPEGGTVSISIQDQKETILLSVSDTGIGLTIEEQKALFDFNTTPPQMPSNTEQGAGIGLVLCKEFLDLLGSSIQVNSTKNAGTSFSFSLNKAT